ncbi:hypothetical protein C1645_817432 [Glomus cerebriforme]|uniref:Uncharacterized protein n=1 Tax=Glomus cerebriforme TaxID=658196 RepID=A0A397TD08_9GLOM|nr:hypothetical protein C1645_817432 [Glomus cerebriforme]
MMSIKPVVSEVRDEVIDKKAPYKFSCNLTTILAQDKEVIAVRLKISEDSPRKLKANSDALAIEILSYYSNKLGSRINKLKKDLTRNPDDKYIKSFIGYASANLKEFDLKKLNDVNKSKISVVCQSYYEQLDKTDKSEIPQKFLEHLRKVGSYVASAINYEHFKDECLKNDHIVRRLKRIYSDEIGQLKLDDSNIKTHVYLHAEMNILASMIDQEDKNKTFIAKLSQVASINFRIESLKYILKNLDQVIENKIKHNTESLDADSDSNASSQDSKNVSDHKQEIYRLFMKDYF